MKITDFDTVKSAKHLDDKIFTITHIRPDTYQEDIPAVTFTIKDPVTVDGKDFTEFWTTRQAAVSLLTKEAVLNAVNNDASATLGPLRWEKVTTKNNRQVFVLRDA